MKDLPMDGGVDLPMDDGRRRAFDETAARKENLHGARLEKNLQIFFPPQRNRRSAVQIPRRVARATAHSQKAIIIMASIGTGVGGGVEWRGDVACAVDIECALIMATLARRSTTCLPRPTRRTAVSSRWSTRSRPWRTVGMAV